MHPTSLAARFAPCSGDAGTLPGRQLCPERGWSCLGARPPLPTSPKGSRGPLPHVLAQPNGGEGAAAQLAQSLVSRVEHLSFPRGVVASCGDCRQETLLTSPSALRLREQLRPASLLEEQPHRSRWPPLAWEEPGKISALEPRARGLTCVLGCQHLLLHLLLHGPAAQQSLARGDGGGREPGRGARAVRSSALYSFKELESCRAAAPLPHAAHIDSLSYPGSPLAPSFPSAPPAPGAGLLQTLLALHRGRDSFKSSEEESWQAGAGQGSWRCAARPGPGGSLGFPCASCGFSGA